MAQRLYLSDLPGPIALLLPSLIDPEEVFIFLLSFENVRRRGRAWVKRLPLNISPAVAINDEDHAALLGRCPEELAEVTME